MKMEFTDITHIEDVIMASEIMADTKEISVIASEICTDEALTAIARGAPKLRSLRINNSSAMTDRALLSVAKHCS